MLDTSCPPDRSWSWPTAIRFGAGRLSDLPAALREMGASNPLFVTDEGLLPLPPAQAALAVLKDAAMAHGVFAEVQPNPTGVSVEQGVAAFRAGGHDAVIAFGGGSALDAAKAVALMVHQSRPIWDFEDIGDNWTRVDTSRTVPVIAIPTTAGTGSELGRSSIITDSAAHRKLIIFHPIMMPQIAILDPELTVGLPPALTASTGMDALCHALETWITPNFHPMADGLALQALRMIKDALPRAFADGTDLAARADMLIASGMACVALQKGLGGVHALSHSLGAVYDLPHGLLNAILMPHVTALNMPAAEARLAELARLLDLPGQGAQAVIDWLETLRDTLDIPASLRPLGVDETRLDEVVALALRDPCAAANPAPFDAELAEAMLRRALG
ncbi:iron-containing alcohol dehydrogenase [Salipiger sp. 1_MG-2023]|uniref:iron-containing alcohol dehydrogenase n=1 Tax=Salipiger sp. 1_MG-2023 TaxID=3062665 RepID=UPI0026E282CA|nr:iron-containing alcohol dehydrogenase [Salipiger sp. 1_MG-2023]MDO6584726.1 iron-containing alcohol dehydrogenase [Salipiger sp. 1_MG-2023]